MKRNLVFLVIMAILISACGGKQKKDETNTGADETKDPITLSIVEFSSDAGNIVGEEVIISGLVHHVCQHGGKRMFLIDTATQDRVKIVTGENIASFNTDLEGQDVIVQGKVDELRIDEAYLTEWETELEHSKADADHEGDGHGEGKMGDAADQGEHIAAYEQIENYRKQIAES